MRPVTAHPASTGTPGHNPVRLSSRGAPGHRPVPRRPRAGRPPRHRGDGLRLLRGRGRRRAAAGGERGRVGPLAAPPAGAGRDRREVVHRHDPAGDARELARRRRADGDPGAGPSRGGGGDGAGRRRGGRAHDPVVPRHLPARGRGGRGAGRAAVDAGVHLAGAGAHRRAGQPGRRARLRRAGPDRRRAGVGAPPARVAHGRAPARRPGPAQPGRRQHRAARTRGASWPW